MSSRDHSPAFSIFEPARPRTMAQAQGPNARRIPRTREMAIPPVLEEEVDLDPKTRRIFRKASTHVKSVLF